MPNTFKLLVNLDTVETNSINKISEDVFYDIIGDVHGYAKELEELLLRLGYSKMYGTWKHMHRKAVFVGDFIDRGPDSKKVLSIIKNMVDEDAAYAILGNHEINMLLYLTKNPETGKSFRKPSESSRKLIEQVRQEFEGDNKAFKEYLRWMRKLPIYLDFGKLRVVHAYWNEQYMHLIDEYTTGRLSKKVMALLSDPDHPLATALNGITKGVEMKLPADLVIKDATNIRRTNFRIKWWEQPEDKTFFELSFGNKFKLPDYTVPKELLFPFEVYDTSKPMLFVGHYCVGKENVITAPNICCIDACVASGGSLGAYRWNGEDTFIDEHFVFVDRYEDSYK